MDFITRSIVLLVFFATTATSADIFLEWHVSLGLNDDLVSENKLVIAINGMFPGPLINATTNDIIHVNVFNGYIEPVLFTWNGIQQRQNSWQDGVSGTNCPIQPQTNWTYVFETKDQIGTFFYFPSINFLKAGGGFGPIRVNNRAVISVPFPKPEAEFDLLIGDWYNRSYMDVRDRLDTMDIVSPSWMLINGKGPYMNNFSKTYETFNVTQGQTYLLRISNVGTAWSFNFRIQNHKLLLVETEGSYVNQIDLDSLDVHVGQSYSVLVTANQNPADYYIVASPKMSLNNSLVGIAVLHYDNSTTQANGPLPIGPDPFDLEFSINQAKSIRWNLTAGAARPNPQGTFNVTNVTISQTFILEASTATIDQVSFHTVNNVSYSTPKTPLKLADHFSNGSGVYELDAYSKNTSNVKAVRDVFVASALHKEWAEIVVKNTLTNIDSWHLDGYSFFVVGYGEGEWKEESRSSYNLFDPVVRSTVQVFPGGWSAVYVYPDNPGMWNLRSQNLKSWYLGEELYVRVFDPNPNPAKEKPPPQNLLLCGKYQPSAPPPTPPLPPSLSPPPPPPPNVPSSKAYNPHTTRSLLAMITTAMCFICIGFH
ncbi:multi-copper oxidase-like protein [Medicago truncatula]|uniref:Multi-copper oxidase-like protein n=1 Tax=Medicago truncatula TaxID=3880 RepID=A0A072VPH7_MEDTR|nr:multi-copper oxidase-like protein [Medicago truncatula]